MDVPVKNVGRPDQIYQNSSYSSTKTLILDLQDAKNRGPHVQKKSFQLPSARLAPGGWQRGGFQFPLTHGILEGTAGGIPRRRTTTGIFLWVIKMASLEISWEYMGCMGCRFWQLNIIRCNEIGSSP